MAKIKVTRGGCGVKYTDASGNARYALKTPELGVFDCDDAQAERLVNLGVAVYANDLGWKQEAPQSDEQQGDTGEPSQEPEKAAGHLDVKQLEEMDYNDLKALAADMGVVPEGKKKADYIAAIAAVEVELGPKVDPDDVDDPDNDLPELSAADPE